MIVGKRRTRVALELLPCLSCGKTPQLAWRNKFDCQYECINGSSTGWCSSESHARKEWNRRFGKRPESQPELWPCDECGELPRSFYYDGGPAPAGYGYAHGACNAYTGTVSNDGVGYTFAQAVTKWNERFGREPEPPEPWVCGLCEMIVPHGEKCRCPNPHGLTPCACGEIPRPVACLLDGDSAGWWWYVECPCGVEYGAFTDMRSLAHLWGGGLASDPSPILERRYDIPTSEHLGCTELPEEYR